MPCWKENRKTDRYNIKVRLKHDLLLNLNHKLRNVKNEESALKSGWHRLESKRVAKVIYF